MSVYTCVCVCIEYHSKGNEAVNDGDDMVLAVEGRQLLTSLP